MIYRIGKRIFDIVVSLLAIVILSWLFLILAIMVKVTSEGKILFHEERIGKNGKPFKILKYRTMVKDAEKNIKTYFSEEQYQEWLLERKVDNDPRITKLGYRLRRLSLDELPQLFNVFIGQMSFIGPRPLPKDELDGNYTLAEQELLLSVRPGLSGNWAANGRSNVGYKNGVRQKLELDYVKKKSFRMDINLIFRTLRSLVRGGGAM